LLEGSQLCAKDTQAFTGYAVGLPALLGWQRLNPSLLLQASNRAIECSWPKASSGKVRNVFDHRVSVLWPIGEAGKHKQGWIGIVSPTRVTLTPYYVWRTSHGVVISRLTSHRKKKELARVPTEQALYFVTLPLDRA
jgi:hypothetical protein